MPFKHAHKKGKIQTMQPSPSNNATWMHLNPHILTMQPPPSKNATWRHLNPHILTMQFLADHLSEYVLFFCWFQPPYYLKKYHRCRGRRGAETKQHQKTQNMMRDGMLKT